MKTDRIGRAGVLALTVVGLLAVSWVLPPAVHQARRLCPVRPDGIPESHAYAAFARRYGVECSVCHNSFPQLNETGYKFQTAGYRMPDEVGSDAKWSNWGDNTSVKLVESYKVAATTAKSSGPGKETGVPEANGFSNAGFQWYPIEGAFGKYFAANDEIDVTAGKTPTVGQTAGTAGQVTMTNANAVATIPINADAFLVTRVGLISLFQGYGAADRAVGAVSPTFLPTPSQIQPGGGTASFTYNGFKAAGEGVELALNWKDTHVSAQVTNGYNSFNNSNYQGEDNHYKDFSVFVNQMIGENAIAASFYNGTAGYNTNAATLTNGIGGAGGGAPFVGTPWYDNYMRGIVYATIKALPSDKLDLLLGCADGVDHSYDLRTHNAGDQFHSMGEFATLQSIQHVLSQQLTTALSYGTNRASTSTGGNRVSDVTLSFAVPIPNNKFDFSLQTRRTQAVNTRDIIADIAQVQWELMY